MSTMSDEQSDTFELSEFQLEALIKSLKNKLTDEQSRIEKVLELAKEFDDAGLNRAPNISLDVDKHLNTCFELNLKIESCLEKLRSINVKGTLVKKSSNILVQFMAAIPSVRIESGPKAMIVVISKDVEEKYIEVLRDKESMENVLIVSLPKLLSDDVCESLANVEIALIDGSEENYKDFVGGAGVWWMISHYVGNRLYKINDDSHRDSCFERYLKSMQ